MIKFKSLIIIYLILLKTTKFIYVSYIFYKLSSTNKTFLFVFDKAIAITSWIESILVTFIFMVHIRWTLVKLQFLCHVFFWMSWSTNKSVHIPIHYMQCLSAIIYLYIYTWCLDIILKLSETHCTSTPFCNLSLQPVVKCVAFAAAPYRYL